MASSSPFLLILAVHMQSKCGKTKIVFNNLFFSILFYIFRHSSHFYVYMGWCGMSKIKWRWDVFFFWCLKKKKLNGIQLFYYCHLCFFYFNMSKCLLWKNPVFEPERVCETMIIGMMCRYFLELHIFLLLVRNAFQSELPGVYRPPLCKVRTVMTAVLLTHVVLSKIMLQVSLITGKPVTTLL